MIWFTWRRHRTEFLAALGVLVIGGVFLLITGISMAHTLHDSGLGACLAQRPDSGKSGACAFLGNQYLDQYGPFFPRRRVARAANLFGVMVGAPLVAREYEGRFGCSPGSASPVPVG